MKKRRKLLSLILSLALLLTLAQPVLALGVSEGNSTSTYEEYVEENQSTPETADDEIQQEEQKDGETTEQDTTEQGVTSTEQGKTEEEVTQNEEQVVTNELVRPRMLALDAGNEITWTDGGEFPYITKVQITDEKGNGIGDNTFDRDQGINLRFEFSIPNDVIIQSGEMYTIPIPEGFEIVNDLAEMQLDESSSINATWELKGNTITIRFYESLDAYSNVSGYMQIGCWFDKDSQLGQDGEDITFVIDGKTYTVDVYYDEITDAKSANVSKKGSYNQNTKEVTWTITVTPDSNNATLAGVTISDSYDTSILDYAEGSFTVNGTAIADSNVNFSETGFTYQFPTDTTHGTKTITFKTAVMDSYFLSEANSNSVSNFVFSIMPNGDKSSEANAETTVPKQNMEKVASSYNAVTQRITWKIVANKNRLSLQDATIVDKYPEGSEIDTNSIRVGGQKVTDYTIDSTSRTLTINLGDISDSVTITYDMIITDFSKFQQSNGSYKVENYAELKSGNDVIEKVNGETSIGIGTSNIPIDKGGNVRVNYAYGQYIEWWVNINSMNSPDYKEITEPIVFTDVLPEGLKFASNGQMTITCNWPDGSHAINYLTSSEVYNSQTNTVSYTITPGMSFGGKTSSPDCWYTISIPTEIVGTQEGSFTNTASVTVGNQTNSDSATVEVSYKTEDMIGKSGSYDYANNTYSWTIQVNKGKQALENPVIVDYLPEGHVPADDYILMGATRVPLNGEDTYGDTAVYDSATNTITIKRDGTLYNNALNIYIRTKYVGEKPQGDATNNVELKADNIRQTFKASHTIKYKPLPILVKKTNYVSGDTITWQVVLNLDHDDLGHLSLTDELSPGLSFDTSSVKLYLATISNDGSITATDTQIFVDSEGIKYDSTTGLVTIALPDIDTHQCYILEFDTYIQDKTLTSVTNSITFTGTDFQEGATSDNVILKTTSSGSGIVGEAGTVRIKKLDQVTDKPLEGVTFQLLNQNKEPITSAGWAVTNSEGVAEFEDWLRLDTTYYIQEVRTIEGYVYDDTMYEVKVNSSDEDKVIEVTVYNQPDAKVTVEGTKTWDDENNKDGIRPESIKVNLLADGKIVQTIDVTAEDGWKYSFTDLPKYAEGKEIVYTISEEPVSGYETTIDGYNLTNKHTAEPEKDPEGGTTTENTPTPTPESTVKTSSTPEPTPQATNTPNINQSPVPQTGDSMNITMLVIIAIIALAGLITFMVMKRKTRK